MDFFRVIFHQVKVEHFRHEFSFIFPQLSLAERDTDACGEHHRFDYFFVLRVSLHWIDGKKLFDQIGFHEKYADFIENITYGDVDTGVECSLIVLSLFVKGDSFVPIIQEGDAQERKGRFIAGVSQICEEFLVASDFSFGLVVVAIEEESEECRKKCENVHGE